MNTSNRAYIAQIKVGETVFFNVWNGTREECEAHFNRLADKLNGEVVKFKSKAAKRRYGF